MADKYNFLNFTVFDFETSGLDPRTDHVIEACVVRVRDGEIVSTFNTLVKLPDGKKLVPKIEELTGHTNADIALGMDDEELFHMLAYMIPEDELLVAHNALFDMSFLAYGLHKYGFLDNNQDDFRNPFIDTLTIARNREPYPHKLIDVCTRNKITLDDAHSALADTIALVDLVIHYHKNKDISEWVNVAGYRPKYGEPTWYPPHTKIIKQGSEVIEHSKKPVAPPRIKPKTVVTKNKKKPNPASLSTKQFEKEYLPTGLIDEALRKRIDDYVANPVGTFECCVPIDLGDDEPEFQFEKVMNYIVEVKRVPLNIVDNYLDNPAESMIGFTLEEPIVREHAVVSRAIYHCVECRVPQDEVQPDEDPFRHHKGEPCRKCGGKTVITGCSTISEDDLPF